MYKKSFSLRQKNAKTFLKRKVEYRYRLPENRKNTFPARKTHILQSEKFSGNTKLGRCAKLNSRQKFRTTR